MIQGFDPRTGEPVGEPVAETTDAEVDAIVAAALAVAPAWGAGTALARRATALEAMADALDDRAGELAVIADTETALGGERLIGEVARTTTQLRMFAGVLRNGSYEDAVVTHAEGVIPDLRRINRPVGPVAVFAASNFPFAFSVAGGDTASALAAGCPVVVKAHEAHPVTSDLTAEVVTAGAGLGRGAGGCVRAGARGAGGPAAAPAPGHRGGRVHRVHRRRAGPGPDLRRAAGPDPVLRRARLGQPVRGATRRRVRPPGRGRHRVRRVADPGRRPVLHQPRPAASSPRTWGCCPRSPRRSAPARAAPMLSGRIFAGYEDAVAEARGSPGRHRAGRWPAGAGTVGGHAAGVPAHAEGVRRRPRGAVPRAVRPGRAGHHLSVGRRPAAGARRATRQPRWHGTR